VRRLLQNLKNSIVCPEEQEVMIQRLEAELRDLKLIFMQHQQKYAKKDEVQSPVVEEGEGKREGEWESGEEVEGEGREEGQLKVQF